MAGLVQPSLLPLMSAQTMPKRPAEASTTPRRSRRLAGPWLSRRANQASGNERDADGHVDPEDPVPGHALDDGATDERTDGDGQAADGAPARRAPRRDASGATAADSSVSVEWRHDGRADALGHAAHEEHLDARGHGRERGGGGEDGHADDEHAPSAEAVAERGAGEQEDGERQRVGVDGPLELLDASHRAPARMTLSAVETTRLSSMTMTRATDVTANVQRAR